MKEEKKSNQKEEKTTQQIYRVRVYKDFDYPSFSINKLNKLEDVSFKAMEEMRENYDNPNYFNFEIINILPFSLKTEITETTGDVDYDFFIREISLEAVREKYGEISYETNPKIFQKISETDTSVTYNLIAEVEAYYIIQIKRYTDLIRHKKIPRNQENQL